MARMTAMTVFHTDILHYEKESVWQSNPHTKHKPHTRLTGLELVATLMALAIVL